MAFYWDSKNLKKKLITLFLYFYFYVNIYINLINSIHFEILKSMFLIA